jgi:hypothetical protein
MVYKARHRALQSITYAFIFPPFLGSSVLFFARFARMPRGFLRVHGWGIVPGVCALPCPTRIRTGLRARPGARRVRFRNPSAGSHQRRCRSGHESHVRAGKLVGRAWINPGRLNHHRPKSPVSCGAVPLANQPFVCGMHSLPPARQRDHPVHHRF